jgi:hypothetical protein
MVKYVGYVSEDTRDLSEIGLFQNIKKNLTRKGEGKSFTAKTDDIKMHVEGQGMLFVLKKPVSGKMNKVEVKVDGSKAYDISGLSLKIRKFKDFFKGNYEAKIFDGKDQFTGSKQADKLYGFNGADNINGAGGNDKLVGGKGNDLLDGADGKNTLTGNQGNDAFRFSSQLNSKNYSTITDFTIGEDRIDLANASFPNIGSIGALSASKFVLKTAYAGQSHVVVYDKATGELSYDTTGGSLADAIAFGKVTANLNLTHTDIFVV